MSNIPLPLFNNLTNEEKYSGIYSDDSRPTSPSSVTSETSLDSLNLNWSESDLPERIRTRHVHRLHPYLGKFIPQIVEIFLRKYFKPGQTILDPFCGSGTTLVQANELNINSIGVDISAFNVLLCNAKTQKYNGKKAKQEILDILEKTRAETQKEQSLLIKEKTGKYLLPSSNSAYLDEWFSPNTLYELLTYKYCIDTGDYEYKDLLKIILSRSARSARLVTHFDLDFPSKPQIEPYYCYKHGRTCQPTQEAYKFLYRYSLDTIDRIIEFDKVRTTASVIVCHADSRKVELPPIDGLISSPPYVGLIDYHQQHVYAYHLLGLMDLRTEEIGAAKNGSSQKAKEIYQQDLICVFKNAANSMMSGGRMIVIAGDKYNLYDEIALKCGLETEFVLNRHVNRRTGRRSTNFFESVFIWRKP
jgi:DNA modification methylase